MHENIYGGGAKVSGFFWREETPNALEKCGVSCLMLPSQQSSNTHADSLSLLAVLSHPDPMHSDWPLLSQVTESDTKGDAHNLDPWRLLPSHILALSNHSGSLRSGPTLVLGPVV